MDIPIIIDTPTANEPFAQYADTKGWNVKTNQRLASTPLWSPRVGFRWDINKDRRYILRGGVGVFTGRIPFVWISNNYANTGIQVSSFKCLTLQQDWNFCSILMVRKQMQTS